ncbi:hypothetical protein ACFLEY_07280 [Bradyrhizobium sp. YCK136]|uniref:hypothetical protein n=1 Tax=Bradyrhizobium sp. YCK136 TaxID=3351346 RepID=UPI0037C6F411
MFENIQKLVPWMSDLPLIPKIGTTLIVVLVTCILLYLVWVPLPTPTPADSAAVKDAYSRMVRVLSRVGGTGDAITVDGKPVGPAMAQYYHDYFRIGQYTTAHPGDIKGAYDIVWGGINRTFTNDTQTFEAVVSQFMIEWLENSRSKKKPAS